MLDRDDRFVEAQTAIIAVLCPAGALNSGSRQRRSIIAWKKSSGGWDGEKKLCKEEIGHLCQRLVLTMMSQRKEKWQSMGVQGNFYPPGRFSHAAYLITSCI